MQRSPLDTITRLLTKPERLVCGLMSGTSVDAIDMALVRIRGGGPTMEAELLYHSETLYAEELQNRIFANSEVSSSNVNDICLLHSALAYVYADAVRDGCQAAGWDIEEVDLIGMHGQTVRHLPARMDIGGHSVPSTLQIGSGSTLATLLQKPVVYDFRAGDMALGGQGAPLVPYVDYLLFRSESEDRVLLNIGGIANMTLLPRGCGLEEVVAFDSGPGNMLVDALMRKFYGREFDEHGRLAASGTVSTDLLSWLLQHAYYRQAPPKSAGREMFGESYISDMIHVAHELNVTETADLVATVAELTVRSIAAQLKPFIEERDRFHLLVSGGGARNQFFMDGLHYAFPEARVETTSSLGIDSDAKEAIAFAVLANEWLLGNPANLPSVTGAARPALLGALALPA